MSGMDPIDAITSIAALYAVGAALVALGTILLVTCFSLITRGVECLVGWLTRCWDSRSRRR